MTEDLHIQRLIWEGKVPVCFTLSPEDLAHEDHIPPPVYMLVSRVSYFPLAIEKVTKQFIQFTNIAKATHGSREGMLEAGGFEVDRLPERTSQGCLASSENGQFVHSFNPEHEVWLEYNNQPLKWHYPVGLIFDLYATNDQIPWKITVHFSHYPRDILLSPPVNRPAVESHFISMIKEADALKHRSYIINQMQARDHRQLWNSLVHNRFEQFWVVNSKLMAHASALLAPSPSGNNDEQTGAGQEDSATSSNTDSPQVTTPTKGFRYIPCRLYRATDNYSTLPTGFVQKLIQPYHDNGSPMLLKDVLEILYTPQSDASSGDNAHSENIFFIHGITLPNETPIQWISEHMSYPDNFIHIGVVRVGDKHLLP